MKKNSGTNIKNTRNGKIELLRFIFCIYIACFHLKCSLGNSTKIFSNGFLGVEFFFIVSGYLLAKSLSKFDNVPKGEIIRTSVSFVWKKYASFVYYYIVVIIITSIAWIQYFQLTLEQWIRKIFGALPTFLLLQMFGFDTAEWYGPTWYLSAMMIVIFILTPILIRYSKIYSLYISPVLSLLLLGLIYHQCGTFDLSNRWRDNINYGLIRAFAEISLGCTCYYIVKSGILKRVNKYLLSAVALSMYLISFVCMTGSYGKAVQASVIILLTIATVITFYNRDTFTFLNNKFIYFLGKLSLTVFLSHSICRFYITKYIAPDIMPLYLYIGIYLLFVFALSIICLLGGDGLKWLLNKLSKKTGETIRSTIG